MVAANSISRSLPHDIEAEECLLACCFMDGAAVIGRCQQAQLSPATFYDTKHGIIYETILDLFARQVAISIETVALELRTQRKLDAVGGYAFLAQVTQRIPTTAQAEYFLGNVQATARLRELIRLATGLVEECYQYTGDFEFAEKRISHLSAALNSQDDSRTWVQAVDEGLALTRERMKPAATRDTGGLELSWGIDDFDRFFHPIEVGELVVIGGYTSSGKSSLLRQVMWSIAKSGHPALIETIEVRDAEEAVNLAGHISGIRSRSRLDALHDRDKAELLEAFETMKMKHFAVYDQDHDLASMTARARAFKRKYGLKAFGADYLQIMRNVKNLRPGERPDFAISCVTSEFKRFATRERVACFLLSGFNREYIRAGNREPKMSDLDGSSSIEKDASRVILLDVPTEYAVRGEKHTQSLTADAADQPTLFVKAIQAKGRNQGTASVGLIFHRETKTFRQLAK